LDKLIRAKHLLKQVWGYDSFRDGQEELISAVLMSQDVIGLFPTGSGKSMAYQIPALIFDGVCLVISPLIALMTDQVAKLKQHNIKAASIHSGLTKREIDIILDNCIYGKTKLLFVSPERINSQIFKARIQKMNLSLIAVDEGHCISQWGHDFRPSYQNIAAIKEIKADVKSVVLTATANKQIVDDIKSYLKIPSAKIIKKSFRRSNLLINIIQTDNKLELIDTILSRHTGSSIIYVRHRKTAFDIYQKLKTKISCHYYHAGLSYKVRAERQEAWINNDIKVMIATNAFGMGIDKAEVRLIIHYGLSPTIEEYYQEIGRAGRDGNHASTYLLYNQNDIKRLLVNHEKSFPSIQNIRKAYGLLHNYYEISVGAGEFQVYDFDIHHFAKYCNASVPIVYRLIKQIEKLNFIKLSQGYKSSEKIKLLVDRDVVFELSEDFKNIAVYLLRNIENIVSSSARINTKKIANEMEIEHADLMDKLLKMDSMKLVNFNGNKEAPQITFLQARFAQQNLYINERNYKSRKAHELERNEKLISMLSANECRLKYILNYFEEFDAAVCGHCDHCKRLDIDIKILTEEVENKIVNGVLLKSFLNEFEFYKIEHVLKVIHQMIDEDLLSIVDQKLHLN